MTYATDAYTVGPHGRHSVRWLNGQIKHYDSAEEAFAAVEGLQYLGRRPGFYRQYVYTYVFYQRRELEPPPQPVAQVTIDETDLRPLQAALRDM